MHIRKFAGFLAVLVLAFGILASTALACHGRHRETYTALCTVEGCEAAGRHEHDGVIYCGYEHSGGYCDGACAALCTVEGCKLTGRHVHDGVTCCGSAHSGGYCDGSCAASSHGGRSHHGRHC